jgi:hypothetical protein
MERMQLDGMSGCVAPTIVSVAVITEEVAAAVLGQQLLLRGVKLVLRLLLRGDILLCLLLVLLLHLLLW